MPPAHGGARLAAVSLVLGRNSKLQGRRLPSILHHHHRKSQSCSVYQPVHSLHLYVVLHCARLPSLADLHCSLSSILSPPLPGVFLRSHVRISKARTAGLRRSTAVRFSSTKVRAPSACFVAAGLSRRPADHLIVSTPSKTTTLIFAYYRRLNQIIHTLLTVTSLSTTAGCHRDSLRDHPRAPGNRKEASS